MAVLHHAVGRAAAGALYGHHTRGLLPRGRRALLVGKAHRQVGQHTHLFHRFQPAAHLALGALEQRGHLLAIQAAHRLQRTHILRVLLNQAQPADAHARAPEEKGRDDDAKAGPAGTGGIHIQKENPKQAIGNQLAAVGAAQVRGGYWQKRHTAVLSQIPLPHTTMRNKAMQAGG